MKVCFFVVRGWANNLAVDGILAEELERRGHSVEFLDCDGLLSFCHLANVHDPSFARHCANCRGTKTGYRNRFRTHHLALDPKAAHEIRAEVFALDMESCLSYARSGHPVGLYALSSIRWFLCRTSLRDEDLLLVRDAVASTAMVVEAAQRYLELELPDAVVTLNGEFFAERAMLELCRARGIRVLTHELTFYFKIVAALDTAVWTDITDRASLVDTWRSKPADIERARRFRDDWVRRLGYSGGYGIDHHNQRGEDVRADLGLDRRPVAAAFGNVTFDTAVLGRNRVFESIFDWTTWLVQEFARRPDRQLVLRCHPAESRYAPFLSREPLGEFVRSRFPELPANVRVVDAAQDLSSYALLDLSTACLVYTSTIGLETAMRGRLPLVAANAHYTHRGFTDDPSTLAEYQQALARHLDKRRMLDPGQTDAVLRYIDYFFQHRLLGLRGLAVRAVHDQPPEIRPKHPVGRWLRPDRGLDALVAAIEHGTAPLLRTRPLDSVRERLGGILQRARASVRRLAG